MRYLCLIYDNENAPMDEAAMQARHQAYEDFTKKIAEAGVMRGGDALEPTSLATTVRVRNDETLTTDGPFAETKEQLGGYYELECADLDEALKWAALIPSGTTGSIEVRPIREFE